MKKNRLDESKLLYRDLDKDKYIDNETKEPKERKTFIANAITQLRLEHGYTQEEISQAIGIAQQTYAGYEKLRSEPNTEILCRIADIYEISLDRVSGRRYSTTSKRIKDKIDNDRASDFLKDIITPKGKYNRATKKTD